MTKSRTVKKARQPVLAVDLGGTKIFAAIVTHDGHMTVKERFPTQADEEPRAVINRLLLAIRRVLAAGGMEPSQLDSISIAAAGGVDMDHGLITHSPNLPGWRNIPLRALVQERYIW
jgi:glucokinase